MVQARSMSYAHARSIAHSMSYAYTMSFAYNVISWGREQLAKVIFHCFLATLVALHSTPVSK